jgi:hypothetical protein
MQNACLRRRSLSDMHRKGYGPMFIKLAFVTSAFYLIAAVLLEAAFFSVSLWKGEALIYLTRWGGILLFGLVWLVSFNLAWHYLSSSKVVH